MVDLFDLVVLVLVAAAGIPAAVFALECFVGSAWKLGAAPTRRAQEAPPFVVLMPAHNEAGGIEPVLQQLREGLRPQDRVLVVADNCSDNTAELARRCGALVLERTHATDRGKGFALTYGIDHLRREPPAVVVVMDADCFVSRGTLVELAAECAHHQRPTQADYLLGLAQNANFAGRISAFAVAVRNRVRPLGLARLGLPCQLLGSGMAFPWKTLADAPEMGSALTEDLAMGFELALSGHSPRFYPWVSVSSRLPTQGSAALSQRRRWEHGQLDALLRLAPRAVLKGLIHQRLDLIALGLDTLVPPLALFVTLLTGLWLGAATWWAITGNPVAFVLASIEYAVLGLAILAAWLRFGRHILTLGDFLGVPGYVVSKLGIYLSFATRRKQGEWVRTARDHERTEHDDG